MLAVGVIVILSRAEGACPPPMYAMSEDPRRSNHQPHAWTKAEQGGWEVRIPISKENIDIAAVYHRDPGFKVRCEFDTLVDPFRIPDALPPKDPDIVPPDPDWDPESEEIAEEESEEVSGEGGVETDAGEIPASDPVRTKRAYTRRK